MSTSQSVQHHSPVTDADDNADTTTEKPTLEGYPKLARLMSLSRQTAIFRRFGELNMITLLRLQAELVDLEHQLQDLRDEDAQSKDPVRMSYIKDFRLMRDFLESGDSLQYELLVTIGDKLREYSITPGPSLLCCKFGTNSPSDAPFRKRLNKVKLSLRTGEKQSSSVIGSLDQLWGMTF